MLPKLTREARMNRLTPARLIGSPSVPKLAAFLTLVAVACFATYHRADAQAGVPIPTRTEVVVEQQIASEGQPIAIAASVSVLGPNPDAPTGTVDFFDAAVLLGNAPLVLRDHQASASIRVTLPAGVHPIIAKYQGTDIHAFSISAPPVPLEILAAEPPQ